MEDKSEFTTPSTEGQPALGPDAAPVQEPAFAPAPEPSFSPGPEPPLSYVPAYAPATAGAPMPAPAPEAAPSPEQPEPAPEAVADSAPEPEAAPAPDAAAAAAAAAAPVPAPEQPASPKRKVKPWMWAVAAAIVVVAAIGIGYSVYSSNRAQAYDDAMAAYTEGDFAAAAEGFQKLGDYEESAAMYQKADQWLTAQAAEETAKDSNDPDLWHEAADAYAATGEAAAATDYARCNGNADYYTAKAILDKAPTDRNAITKALPLFENCDTIDDAQTQARYCKNALGFFEAEDLFAEGRYYDAYLKYNTVYGPAIEKLGDPDAKAKECIQPLPGNGIVTHAEGYTDSCELTIVNTSNPNAYYKLYIDDSLVVSVFITAGEQATFMLPAGTYSMNKAYGSDWFGPDDMFGDDGSYYKCNFGGSTTVELEAGNGYEISASGEGTGIGTQSTSRESM